MNEELRCDVSILDEASYEMYSHLQHAWVCTVM